MRSNLRILATMIVIPTALVLAAPPMAGQTTPEDIKAAQLLRTVSSHGLHAELVGL